MADGRGVGLGPYFVATRLFGVAVQEWSLFNGTHLRQGVDVLKLHPSDFLDVVWSWLTENADQKEIDKIGRKIWLPPRGVEPTDDNPYYGFAAEEAAYAEMQKRKKSPVISS
jgi:hypothetical protein